MGIRERKNGKIELLRFVFSVIVMLFHIGVTVFGRETTFSDNFTFFYNGSFGVEFFFALSGFLMASHIYRACNQPDNLSKETCVFVSKKVLRILPLHIIAFFVAFIVACVTDTEYSGIGYRLLDGLPNMLLIMRSGLPEKDVLTPEWYICQLLFATMLLYPLCRKYYKIFSRIVAPMVAVLVIGYLLETTGSLMDSTYWLGLFSKSFARAVAEICAGVFAFELCRYINKLNFKKADRVFLTVVEVVCWVLVLVFTFTNIDDSYAGHFFIFLCVALCLAFSDVTYGKACYNNKACFFLGSLSLPIYILHPIAQKIVEVCYAQGSNALKVTVFVVFTLILCFVTKPLEKLLKEAIFSKLNQLKGKTARS